MLRVGWHAGNGAPIDDVDWRIMGIVAPELFTYLPFEAIGVAELRRVRELAPQGEAVVRPYYVPREYSLAVVDQYIDLCRRAVDQALQVWPPSAVHLKAWNEPNQPRWGQWEGFGDLAEDLRRYNEAYVRLAEKMRAHAPGVRLHVLSLTDYRDVQCPGDPGDVPYWAHGSDGKGPSSLVADAIMAGDVIGAHVYLHRRPHQPTEAWDTNVTAPYYGARYQMLRKLWPTKPLYITEAGYPNPLYWPEGAGRRLATWLRMVAGDPWVGGVSLWMLGSGQGHNGHWRAGENPVRDVYDVASWREGVPPVVSPETGSGLPALTPEYLAGTREHRLRINAAAALKRAIEAAGQQIGSNEFDANGQAARQYGYDRRTRRWYLWEWTAIAGTRIVWTEDAV